ncbi:translation machinery-associated protein 20 [Aspergillus udagawae]|uniref:Malignant T-cell-amplified sequence 1 n=1 Tax=Aspergillus udagawae TaxID=91492 RepID=A0A8E0V231_9EURO|nr:malignant T-cell-amplified sequence 1 [Aspergillus udagawae]GIC92113.1 malignant T-cell-amplified sequence 1 [Aspergillus udagawae]
MLIEDGNKVSPLAAAQKSSPRCSAACAKDSSTLIPASSRISMRSSPRKPSSMRPDRATLYTIESTPLFYQPMDGPPIPHLKLLHSYPDALPTVQIDRGAIRFVLSGATLMAPGLTSPGGRLPDAEHALEKGQVVAVMAEGKEHACMVGPLTVGTEEMKEKKKGVVMDEGHYLGDGLWKMHWD